MIKIIFNSQGNDYFDNQSLHLARMLKSKNIQMKKLFFLLIVGLVLLSPEVNAQEKTKKIGFFGGFGLSFSTGYTYISLQPGVMYHVSPKFKLGTGIQYSYLKSKKAYYGVNYKYNIFGFNTMAMFYPYKELEMSVEFEDLYVKQNYNNVQNNFWSPALFGGLGYRYGPVTAGFKFNFLFDQKTSVYQDAFIPFVRIYF